MQSIPQQIRARIYGTGKGSVFSAKDFLDLGARSAVDKALARLAADGTIRRVARGLYDFPRYNDELGGELNPDIDRVAHAIARRSGVKIQASGAWAANLLRLSTQVPARVVYLTTGKSRTVTIGNQRIEFRRAGPKEMQAGSTAGALTVHALRHLGRDNVDEAVIRQLRELLRERDRRRLIKDTRYMEDWLYAAAQAIAE